jgi:tRNA-2-methylthio-N6-dimethylallyladenosine synthase
MVGHCISASGAIESVASVLQIYHNFIFPNINCEDLNEQIASLISKHKIPQVLIEKEARKGDKDWSGRNGQNLLTVFPKEHYKVGDLVNVHITDCTSATLIGEAIDYSTYN